MGAPTERKVPSWRTGRQGREASQEDFAQKSIKEKRAAKKAKKSTARSE